MGSRNSSRRNMDSRQNENESGAASGGDANAVDNGDDTNRSSGYVNADLSAILSYLIQSGQVRILNSLGENEDYSGDEEDDYGVLPKHPPRVDPNPDTSYLDNSELKLQMLMETGQMSVSSQRSCASKLSLQHLLYKREAGLFGNQGFSHADCCTVTSRYLPNHKEIKASYRNKAFCGTYSQDGDIFLSACQDKNIRIYDTARGRFKLFKTVRARDVGWSVLDTAFSPDGNHLIYSSWSECIHICNIYGEHELHEALPLMPATYNSFCIFSLCFSQDNNEILGGANDGYMYIYDVEKKTRMLKIDAHEDDVNAVSFADASSHILFSGADDGLCKVWDRRTLNEESPQPVGTLAGHKDGITFIDSKGDGRYLISNSKDQTIKLWDMRRFSSEEAIKATKHEVEKQNWDYRWQTHPTRGSNHLKKIKGDSSLMTYRGHSIMNTLIRCRFSPAHSTGQRFIYSGCASGAIVVYDVLTGKIETKLKGHDACVRDISWHPYENKILSTSWDTSIGEWTFRSSDCNEDSDTSTNRSHGDTKQGKDDQQDPCQSRSSRGRSHRGGSGRSMH